MRAGVRITAAIKNLKKVVVNGSIVTRIPIKAIGRIPHKNAVMVA